MAPRLTARIAIMAALGLGIAGCAVLKIDVDVYSGPLANQKDVQTEQMAVMAVGARPLIVKLRDELFDKAGCFQNQTGSECLNANPRNLQARSAAEVDAVLQLYNDQNVNPTLADLRRRAHKAIMKGQVNAEIFYRQRGLPGGDSVIEGLDAIASAEGEALEANKNLAAAYSKFLLPPEGQFREWRAIYSAMKELAEKKPATEKALKMIDSIMSGQSSKSEPPNDPLWALVGSNIGFRLFEDEKVLREHAKLLFPGEEKSQTNFVRVVGETAASFNFIRAALADLLEISFETLMQVNELGLNKPEKYDFVESLSVAAVNLIHTGHLRLALCIPEQTFSLGQIVRSEISDIVKSCPNSENIDKGDYKKRQKELSSLMMRKPRQTAVVLLALHRWLRGDGAPPEIREHECEKPECRRFADSGRLEHGLVPGPSNSFKLDHVNAALSGVGKGLGTGLLTRGRLEAGLFRLIQNYLDASHAAFSSRTDTQADEQERDRQRNILLAALVRFAEKVLFLANNVRVFEILDEKERVSVYGSEENDTLAYSVVMQEIGNTILANVDAIYSRQDYERRAAGAATAEIEAIRHIFDGGAPEIYARFIDKVEARKQTLDREQKVLAAKLKAVRADLKKLNTAAAAAQKAAADADKEFKKAKPAKDYKDKLKRYKNARDILGKDEKVIAEISKLATRSCGACSFLDKVVAFIQEEREAAEKAKDDKTQAERFVRLKDTVTVIGEVRSKVSATEERPDQLEKLKTLVNDAIVAEQATVDTADTQREKAKEDLETAEKNLTAKKLGAAKKDAEEKTLKDSQTKLDKRAKKARDALDFLNDKEKSKAILDGVKAVAGQPVGHLVWQQILGALPSKDDCKADDKKDSATCHAREILAATSPPTEAPRSIAAGARTPKEALDRLIAVLRHKRLRAISDGGEGSTDADHAAEALVEAYSQRTDMIYLRPALAYLRTSFAASTLRDNETQWRNMLGRQALRSLPFGGHIPGDAAQKKKLEIAQEFDNQFWQNINRVRVAGTGRTNYVVTKDDIGNWYVKDVAVNAEKIYASMRRLATFGYTGVAPRPGDDDAKTDKELARAAEQGPMGRLFERYQSEYGEAGKTTLEGLKVSLEKRELAAAIEASWKGDSNIKSLKKGLLKELLDKHAKETLEKAGGELKKIKKDATDADRARAIIGALEVVLRFNADLRLAISGRATELTAEKKALYDKAESELSGANDTNRADLTTQRDAAKTTFDSAEKGVADAIATVKRLAGGEVRDRAGKRLGANKTFDTAIAFIGEANQQ